MSIDRSAYSDEGIFAVEMAKVFAKRSFVGSVYDLQEANDYRSLQIGDRAITVRATADGVRAFNNVCLHRNSLIDPLGEGNRHFRCNYHGWSYRDDGSLKHAPLVDEAAICERRLGEYPVSASNGLFFIGLEEAPEVSDVGQAFERTDSVLAKPFHKGVLEHACNWKLLAENVLEGYHLSFVHRDTFAPAGFTSTAEYRHGMEGGTSWSVMTPKPEDDRSRGYKRISAAAGHHYNHAFVFPNYCLANSNGLVGFQSSFHPTGVGSTRVEWSLWELPALACLAGPVREHFRKDAVEFAEATLLEDKALVESCQVGLSSFGIPSQFQATEERIRHFHAMYRERMES
jgi:phenylpropionate dioxygenase-like ring-hydroxylating dioxygenase large terminal subunit